MMEFLTPVPSVRVSQSTMPRGGLILEEKTSLTISCSCFKGLATPSTLQLSIKSSEASRRSTAMLIQMTRSLTMSLVVFPSSSLRRARSVEWVPPSAGSTLTRKESLTKTNQPKTQMTTSYQMAQRSQYLNTTSQRHQR